MPEILYYFSALTGIYILMTWTIYLPYRTGQLHFLPVACMAVTAYLGAFAGKEWGWPFIAVLLLGVIVGAFIAFIPSLAIGDAPCFSVVIVGLTSVFIVKTIIENLDILGGTIGFFGVPMVNYILPVTYVVLGVIGFGIYKIDHSRLGRDAAVVFVDKEIAASLGINVKHLGIFYQTIAGAFGGASGVLYAYLLGSLFPSFFAFGIIGTLMCMLFIGGYSTMWGAVVAAPIIGGIPLLVPSEIASWRQVVYGGLLIIVLFLKPQGLISRKMLWKLRKITRKKNVFS